MKEKGTMNFQILREGAVYETHVANLPADVFPAKANFFQGDACNLDKSIGRPFNFNRNYLIFSFYR
jgi:hypothetical protein